MMNGKLNRTLKLAGLTAAISVVALAGSVRAEPTLQLYIEGATYDSTTETWTFTAPSSPSGMSLRLWAIGNTTKGSILDVKLAAAYDSSLGDLGISLTPSTTGGYGGFTDPSTPVAPTDNGRQVGGVPKLYDGKDLPKHGEYGDDVAWEEFLLGDFTLEDSPLGDFNGSGFPTGTLSDKKFSQINVYDILITNEFGGTPDDAVVHFDLYNHVQSKNKGIFAPFSHDAEGEGGSPPAPPSTTPPVSVPVPAPGLAGLIGLAGLATYNGVKRRLGRPRGR